MNTVLIILIILLSINSQALAADESGFRMLSANQISGLIPDIEDSYGVAFRDFNDDNFPDIYLVCFRNLNRLLINNGGIIPFLERTVESGLGGNLTPRGKANLELGVSPADYDNDGQPDLFLSGWGKTTRLFHNSARLKFEDVTERLNLFGRVDANHGLWLDANNDGYLDLFITDEHHSNRLLMNNKNGYFSEAIWTEEQIDSSVSQGACCSDFDNDGDMDIYVCNWLQPDYLLCNDGRGLFRRYPIHLPTLDSSFTSNSASAADIDNDGDQDLFIATREGRVFFYRNEARDGQLYFSVVNNHPLRYIEGGVYGFNFSDFNHDGWLDCFVSARGLNRLYLNDGRGGFNPGYDTDGLLAYSTGSAVADFDHDGDPDIFVSNKNTLSQIYLNPVNDGRSIRLRLTGVISNRDAVGAKVYFYSHDSLAQLIGFRELTAQQGYLSAGEAVIHFGCGDHSLVDARIVFPSGREALRSALQSGRAYHFYEYSRVAQMLYFGWMTARLQASRPQFWVDSALTLLFIFLIAIHLRLGLKRYHWSTAVMTSQLIVWLIITLTIFLILRDINLQTVMIVLNSISWPAIIAVIAYSEYLSAQRKKRLRFREIVQSLSDRMITIHENNLLYQRLLEAIRQHESINKADLMIILNSGLKIFSAEERDTASNEIDYRFTDKQNKVLLQQSILFADHEKDFSDLFQRFGINILIPIKRYRELYALVGINMEHADSAVNREDLQLLMPIANQAAVAVENNNYIRESAALVQQLTEAKTREIYLRQLEDTNRQLDQKNAELLRLFKELQEKESQLVHSEKMASLGQLVAGISHELNNPISFIYANSQALNEYIAELEKLWSAFHLAENSAGQQAFAAIISELRSIVADTINGSRSVKDLVLHLKNFSRLDQAGWKEAHIVAGLESSVRILLHQMHERIEIIREFTDDPAVYCNPGQLNQVFVNLLSNAIQAIPDKGKIWLRTIIQDDKLKIDIEDTGSGIPEEIRPRIFDPFFTTKDVSKGTGLGLTISYAIIQKHNGSIAVTSEEGKGSRFTILLPLKSRSL
jgi:signal transduction histidine kinase